MTDPLTPADLTAFMQARGIPGEILHLDVPTPTVETAAAALGCSPDQIVKSILFLVRGEPRLAVTCGRQHVEKRTLAAQAGVGRKQVSLADADTVLAVAGYPVGAMPPFGHRQPLATLLDPSVLKHDVVYAGGGSDSALLKVTAQTILAVTGATVLPLHALPQDDQ